MVVLKLICIALARAFENLDRSGSQGKMIGASSKKPVRIELPGLAPSKGSIICQPDRQFQLSLSC
jgi:hypothetical protein